MAEDRAVLVVDDRSDQGEAKAESGLVTAWVGLGGAKGDPNGGVGVVESPRIPLLLHHLTLSPRSVGR